MKKKKHEIKNETDENANQLSEPQLVVQQSRLPPGRLLANSLPPPPCTQTPLCSCLCPLCCPRHCFYLVPACAPHTKCRENDAPHVVARMWKTPLCLLLALQRLPPLAAVVAGVAVAVAGVAGVAARAAALATRPTAATALLMMSTVWSVPFHRCRCCWCCQRWSSACIAAAADAAQLLAARCATSSAVRRRAAALLVSIFLLSLLGAFLINKLIVLSY